MYQYEQSWTDGLWYLVYRFHDETIIESPGFTTRAECKTWSIVNKLPELYGQRENKLQPALKFLAGNADKGNVTND